jgi:Zn-finger nucleic acid-binding protein
MKCPTCPDATLVMADRQGVEIDYCPSCRGVWLDRGELDKIIERVGAATPTSVVAPAPATPPPPTRRRDDDDDRRRLPVDRYGKPYKKKSATKSILGEMFDF